MINRASEGTCRQCGRRILWVRMKSGKNMPVDMALHNYKKDSTGKEKNRHAGRRGSGRKNSGRRAWRWSRLYFALRFMQEVPEIKRKAAISPWQLLKCS